MALTTPPTLEYGRPPPAEGRTRDYVAHLIRWALVAGTVAVVLAGIVPRFEQIFRDFKIQLPWPSQFLLTLSHWFVHDMGWLALAPLPFLLAYLMSLPGGTPRERRKVRHWERLLAFLIVAIFLVYVVMALFMPLISLIQAMSGPRKA
jgi:hypothetical protein